MNSPCRWQTWSSFINVSVMVSGSVLTGHWRSSIQSVKNRGLLFVINVHFHPFGFLMHVPFATYTLLLSHVFE